MYENHEFEAKKIEILERQLADQYEHDKSASLLLKLGFVLTFLLYLMFNQHLYIGDATTLNEYFKTPETMAGFSFLLVVVVLMALFLAWVKHHAYLHFGFFGQVGTVVAVVIGFALFAEFFSASANQDAKSVISLKSNEAYQATIQATNGTSTVATNTGIASLIAAAQQKVARCEEKLKAGKEKHCEGDKAKLQGYLDSEKRALQSAQDASVAQLETNYARQDKLKADSYNPVIVSFAKALAGWLGGGYEEWIKTAVVLAMLIVAVCFEFLHHWLSKSKEASYNAVQGLELELAKLRGGFNPQFNSEGNDNHPAPQAEKKPMGFGQPAMAQFKYQQREPELKQPVGFIRTDGIKPAAKKKSGKSTWNAELSKSGIDSPDDPAMNRQADQAQIDRIMSRGLNTGSTGSETGYTRSETGLSDRSQPVAVDLYPEWKRRVISGCMKPTKRPAQKFIWKETSTDSGEKKAVKADETLLIWKEWLSKAMKEGYVIEDPNWSNGKDKFILVEKYRKGVLGTQEDQLQMV